MANWKVIVRMQSGQFKEVYLSDYNLSTDETQAALARTGAQSVTAGTVKMTAVRTSYKQKQIINQLVRFRVYLTRSQFFLGRVWITWKSPKAVTETCAPVLTAISQQQVVQTFPSEISDLRDEIQENEWLNQNNKSFGRVWESENELAESEDRPSLSFREMRLMWGDPDNLDYLALFERKREGGRISIECPLCDAKLRIPDGKRGTICCSSCQDDFYVDATHEYVGPPERIDGEDDPPPPLSGPGEGFGAPKPGKKLAKGDFRGIKLRNKTHRSNVDPDALLCRKSKAHPALPSDRGHVLMDNRHALIVDCKVTQATGTGERDAAQAMAVDRSSAHQKTIGADTNYDTRGFVAEMHRILITPDVTQNTARSGDSAIDAHLAPRGLRQVDQRPPRHREGVWLDLDDVFSVGVAAGDLRQFKVRGTEKVGAVFGLHVIAYNLIQLDNLLRPAMAVARALGCLEAWQGGRDQAAATGPNACNQGF